MARPSDCPYRQQAKMALVSWAVLSFAVGTAFGVAICTYFHETDGSLSREPTISSCQNTLLAS